MCLSTVYRGDAESKPLAEYVAEIATLDDKLVLTDVTGARVEASGKIKSVDLVKNIIIID